MLVHGEPRLPLKLQADTGVDGVVEESCAEGVRALESQIFGKSLENAGIRILRGLDSARILFDSDSGKPSDLVPEKGIGRGQSQRVCERGSGARQPCPIVLAAPIGSIQSS